MSSTAPVAADIAGPDLAGRYADFSRQHAERDVFARHFQAVDLDVFERVAGAGLPALQAGVSSQMRVTASSLSRAQK